MADAYSRAGDAAFSGARYADADDLYRAGNFTANQADAGRARAHALLGLARVYARLGEYAESSAGYLAARTIYESVHDAAGTADCIGGAARIDAERGRHATAESLYRAALERYPPEAGERITHCWLALAELLTEAEARLRGGDAGTAESTPPALTRLLTTFPRLGADDKTAACAAALAATAATAGRTDEAVRRYLVALDSFEQLGLDTAHRTGCRDPGGALPRFPTVPVPASQTRMRWSATVEQEMVEVFAWAHRLGDRHLVAELVEVDINFGRPARSTAPATRPIPAVGVRYPGATGPRRLIAGAHLTMTAGPRVRMPDGRRIALDRYFELMERRYGRLWSDRTAILRSNDDVGGATRDA